MKYDAGGILKEVLDHDHIIKLLFNVIKEGIKKDGLRFFPDNFDCHLNS